MARIYQGPNTLDRQNILTEQNIWPNKHIIARSLIFNSVDSAYLNRTVTSSGDNKIFTVSFWVKRSNLTLYSVLMAGGNGTGSGAGANGVFEISFNGTNDKLQLYSSTASATQINASTDMVFRDVGAWYHVVIALDTTAPLAANRIKYYVNGNQVSYTYVSTPAQNDPIVWNSTSWPVQLIGKQDGVPFFNGYSLTEIYNIDGQALTPDNFGYFTRDGQWEPKKYTGVYGVNGFYLNFSDNTNTTALGKDYSGNGNNFTPNNFSVASGVGNDSSIDTPTSYNNSTTVVGSNYCTLNSLDFDAGTLAQGNLKFTASGSANDGARSTIGFSSGKYYAEFTAQSTNSGTGGAGVGIMSKDFIYSTGADAGLATAIYRMNGNKYNGSASAAYGATWTNNDVIGIACDMTAGTIEFFKNNVSQGVAYTGLTGTKHFGIRGDTLTGTFNFGQTGFVYTIPTGYSPLCSSTVGTPTITKPNEYFDVVTYTGRGALIKRVSTRFQPNLVWIKSRSGADSHHIYDSVRGVTLDLASNSTGTENTRTNGLTVFDTNGFTIGSDASGGNALDNAYVAWCWKESVTSGFDIVSWTGNGTNGRTIAHGLGATPDFAIVKNRSAAAGWPAKHSSLTNGMAGTYQLFLNTTAAEASSPGNGWITVDSSNITLVQGGTDILNVNANTNTYIAYLWKSISGYSAFGAYTGNNSTNGPFVWTGFKPKYILRKVTSTTSDWAVHDGARDLTNPTNANLYANLANAEDTGSILMDICSNGFKVRSTSLNGSGATVIYAAFADKPFSFDGYQTRAR